MQCIRPGIQRMPVHHAHNHQPKPIYNNDSFLGALVPPPNPPITSFP